MTKTTVVAVAHAPFKLSDYVPDPHDTQQLFDFINTYQQRYREYVKKAIRIGESASQARSNS